MDALTYIRLLAILYQTMDVVKRLINSVKPSHIKTTAFCSSETEALAIVSADPTKTPLSKLENLEKSLHNASKIRHSYVLSLMSHLCKFVSAKVMLTLVCGFHQQIFILLTVCI